MVDVGKIMAYEAGEMEDEDVIAMFQEMVNDGSVWQLQGSYGRMATRLIECGLVTRPTTEQSELEYDLECPA